MIPPLLPPIPWSHSILDFGSVWKWETPHFVVTVNGNDISCYWNITDLTSGKERAFLDGTTKTFMEAEQQVREAIGKSYPPHYGYQTIAGPFATTFTISNGEKLDLGPYVGHNVIATVVADPQSGGTATHEGYATIDHYDLVLTQEKTSVRISPTYLVSIETRQQRPYRKVKTVKARTHPGRVVSGCTGNPGFLPNTVEHNNLLCPIHEQP